MKTDLEITRKDVTGLADLDDYAYERIFKMYKDGDEFFAYNIIKNISIPKDLDANSFYYYRVAGIVSWTQLSYIHYDTINLWWLICLASGVKNPVKLPDPGTVLKILKPRSVRAVLDSISSSIG
jgi:hypothetical protein